MGAPNCWITGVDRAGIVVIAPVVDNFWACASYCRIAAARYGRTKVRVAIDRCVYTIACCRVARVGRAKIVVIAARGGISAEINDRRAIEYKLIIVLIAAGRVKTAAHGERRAADGTAEVASPRVTVVNL